MQSPQSPHFQKQLPIGDFLTYSSQPDIALLKVEQFHSTILLNAIHPSIKEITSLGKGDGIIFIDKRPYNSSILTADCLPIIIIGKKGSCFLHAGWRGIANGILTQKKK